MSNKLLEMYKVHTEAGYKYTYFLLTAAGAGVGLIFQKTAGISFSWWLLPAAFAALFWGLSFFFGCWCLRNYRLATHLNYQIIEQGAAGASKEHLKDGERLHDTANEKASKYSRWQFNFLIFGAICLASWRLSEMTQIYLQQNPSPVIEHKTNVKEK